MRDSGHAPTPVRDGWDRASERDALAVAAELNVVVQSTRSRRAVSTWSASQAYPGLLELDLAALIELLSRRLRGSSRRRCRSSSNCTSSARAPAAAGRTDGLPTVANMSRAASTLPPRHAPQERRGCARGPAAALPLAASRPPPRQDRGSVRNWPPPRSAARLSNASASSLLSRSANRTSRAIGARYVQSRPRSVLRDNIPNATTPRRRGAPPGGLRARRRIPGSSSAGMGRRASLTGRTGTIRL